MTTHDKKCIIPGEWDGMPINKTNIKNFPLEHPLTPPQTENDIVDTVPLHRMEHQSNIYYLITNDILKKYFFTHFSINYILLSILKLF